MSQQNKYELSTRLLPSGGALEWDMTTLTDDQLEHEYRLSYESLYGHTYQGEILIKGLRDPDFDPLNYKKETIEEANRVWSLRFSRAEQELERRYLLS